MMETGIYNPQTSQTNGGKINEKDLVIVKSSGKYGYKTPDGNWFVEPEFDEAYEFEDGYARVVKDGLEGWISFDGESAYCPWSSQERRLKAHTRKQARRNKILRKIGLGPKPMDLSEWDEDDHCRLVNLLHSGWEKFKEHPVIPVTIIFGGAILAYTFFFE